MSEACKKHVIWLDDSVKFLIFIIRFSRGEAGQVSGALFMVEFGQILPFSRDVKPFFQIHI